MSHPELLARIRTEIAADEAGRGYAGKSRAEVVALMNAPVIVPGAVSPRDVSISDVEGFMEARMIPVRLADWVETAEPGVAKDAARTLLRVIASQNLKKFTTSTTTGRANILGLFGAIATAAPHIVTPAHHADLVAMTEVRAPSTEGAPRWSVLREGVPDAPGAVDEAMLAEALA